MTPFRLNTEYSPQGDQGQAIAKLVKSIRAGNRHQTLLGVTGSGKTFTMANVIEQIGKPTLIMSHNKTLAAQLYSEFKNFFPENAVEYFVSYFDYYQPEAYIPRTDTYIEKDSSINDEIERLRLSSMGGLLSREDVIVVASVSCIYGLGSPEDYEGMMLPFKVGGQISRELFLTKLVDMLYERNDSSAAPSAPAATSSRSSPPTSIPKPSASNSSAMKSTASPSSTSSPAPSPSSSPTTPSIPPNSSSPQPTNSAAPSSPSAPNSTNASLGLRKRANSSKPSASKCAPNTTSK